jgi:hypothetical protein
MDAELNRMRVSRFCRGKAVLKRDRYQQVAGYRLKTTTVNVNGSGTLPRLCLIARLLLEVPCVAFAQSTLQ